MKQVKEAFPNFSKPSIAVDTVILRVGSLMDSGDIQTSNKMMQVLLVKSALENEWHLPGTIIRLGETSTSAISRLMDDRSRISDMTFEQLYTVDNDVYRDERGHIISIVYIGMCGNTSAVEDINIINGKYDTQWFWVNKDRTLVNCQDENVIKDLKYDHKAIINDTISRLKGKLLYTNIGFNFIEDEFTLRELENTFTAINERQIPGFRRLIKDRVTNTGKMTDGKSYRPAAIYVMKK